MEKRENKIYPDIVFEISEVLKGVADIANKYNLGSDFSYFTSTSGGIFWSCLIRKKTQGNLARKLTVRYNPDITGFVEIKYFVSGNLTEHILNLDRCQSWKKELETLSLFWVSDLSLEKKEEIEDESR